MGTVKNWKKPVRAVLTALAALLSCGLTAVMLYWSVLHVGNPIGSVQLEVPKVDLMAHYDKYMTNNISSALDGVLAIEKVYWLNDSDPIAPKPDQSKFGTATDPAQLQWLLDEAEELLAGQTTRFSTDVKILPGSTIHYYLDDTILSISWQEGIGTAVFTFCEVKIAHASQFRRFLADGEYGSDKQYYGTDMAVAVNAVASSNGDFYKNRTYGSVIYNSKVYRVGSTLDVCCIDDQGEMLFVYRGQVNGQEAWEQYVKENNVRFSLTFGPILVDDYQNVAPRKYPLGEVDRQYSRAGLGKLDQLHYLLVTANYGPGYSEMMTIPEFADRMASFGCEKAYALDGGQTGIIAMNGQLMNRPDYGTQRTVSDILYFATAIPEGE